MWLRTFTCLYVNLLPQFLPTKTAKAYSYVKTSLAPKVSEAESAAAQNEFLYLSRPVTELFIQPSLVPHSLQFLSFTCKLWRSVETQRLYSIGSHTFSPNTYIPFWPILCKCRLKGPGCVVGISRSSSLLKVWVSSSQLPQWAWNSGPGSRNLCAGDSCSPRRLQQPRNQGKHQPDPWQEEETLQRLRTPQSRGRETRGRVGSVADHLWVPAEAPSSTGLGSSTNVKRQKSLRGKKKCWIYRPCSGNRNQALMGRLWLLRLWMLRSLV